MSFGTNLHHLRDSRNMTQEQLAMLMGVSRQAVSKWEVDAAFPDVSKLVRLSDIFEVSLDELARGDVTGRELVRALAVPEGSPVTDVCGYDAHMLGRARLCALALPVAYATIELAAVAVNAAAGSNAIIMGFLGGRHMDVASGLAILAGFALGLAPLAYASQRHAAFRAAHPYVEDFYSAEDRLRGRRALGAELAAAAALLALWVPVTSALSLVPVMGYGLALASFVGLMGAAQYCLVHALLAWARFDVAGYDRACEARAERAVWPGVRPLCWLVAAVAVAASLVVLVCYGDARFWYAWPAGGVAVLLVRVVAFLVAPRSEGVGGRTS